MISYTKFTVKNFRCFSALQTLHFAQPEKNKLGSGITYIVGANNSGKTTLIEALCLKEGDYLNDSEKRPEDPEFDYYEGEKINREVRLLRKGANKFIEQPNKQPTSKNVLFEVISSRRHWDANSGNDGRNVDRIIEESTKGINPRKPNNVPVGSILRDIESDNEKYKDFTTLVKRVIPDFHQWSVGYENQHYIKYTSQDGAVHRSDFLGDGVISIIRILAHLFHKKTSGLIIDEPELSLHPLAQKKLAKVIAEYSEDRQIIISTHSPYFVSWEYLKNGAVLNRVAKEGTANSHIYTLGKYENYKQLINGANWQQPFLMDVVSKEIFFQDNILFVEGQEDVGLLQRHFSAQDINLFGYGVRGCDQFPLAFKLAKDLGIKKACALIDSPAPSSSTRKEDEIKNKLERDYPDYKVIQWNKADIRDKESYILPTKEENKKDENNIKKESCISPVKEGYFKKDGKLKPKEELDDFCEKIENVKQYFNK